MRKFLPLFRSSAALFLVTLAAFWVVLGLFIGTCTQGSAQPLLSAVVLGFPLYLAGVGLLNWRPIPPLAWLAMLPAVLMVLYQAIWALLFTVAYLVGLARGASLAACSVLTGTSYPPDGREAIFAAGWTAMSLVAVIGLIRAFRRSRRSAKLRREKA